MTFEPLQLPNRSTKHHMLIFSVNLDGTRVAGGKRDIFEPNLSIIPIGINPL
jgi:hypothetical protein